MTSIALASAPAAAFNADFYTTAATVIPVLFIAIGAQGHTQAELIKKTQGDSFWLAAWMLVTMASLVTGTFAEIKAVIVLYDPGFTAWHVWVLSSLLRAPLFVPVAIVALTFVTG